MALFHQKQILLNCAVHCLNNLYQEAWLSSQQMDAIADEMARAENLSPWWSPYRSFIPRVGNYDVLVLVEALKKRGGAITSHYLKNTQLHEELVLLKQRLASDAVIGLIVNKESTNPLHRLVDGRHWLALVRRLGSWWDLDSKLEGPVRIGDVDNLIEYIRAAIIDTNGQAFLVEQNTTE